MSFTCITAINLCISAKTSGTVTRDRKKKVKQLTDPSQANRNTFSAVVPFSEVTFYTCIIMDVLH